MENPKSRIPSDRFQDALNIFEAHLKNGSLKDENAPEWAMMAAALQRGFEVLEKDGKLHLMFDTSNSFDLAILAWCVEARLRQERKVPRASIPNPSLN